MFSDDWSPALSIYKVRLREKYFILLAQRWQVMKQIEDLMSDLPYGQNYSWLNAEAGTLLATDRSKFEETAREWTRKYAC